MVFGGLDRKEKGCVLEGRREESGRWVFGVVVLNVVEGCS